MNNKIAVLTGANGFVGSHTVDYLLEKGYKVRCIVRKSSDLKWLKGKDIELFDCGLTDLEAIKKVFEGATYIFHIAGTVKSKKPEGYFISNVDNTKILLEAALANKSTIKKFVVTGSQTSGGPSFDGVPVKETDIPKPITTYGKSKLAQEELVFSYKDKLPVTVLRCPAIYGERDTEVGIFFQTYAKGLFTTIGFDKKEVSLLHVYDVVNGMYLAATSNKSNGELYYLSSEKSYTWDEIGATTAKVMGKKAVHIPVPHFLVYTISAIAQFFSMFSSQAATLNLEKARDLVQRYWVSSPKKAINQLGFRQTVGLEQGIRTTVKWYIKEGWIKL
ncbi:MAG: NAD(P)-dependent oxidoreductase [Ignavibacteriaceae bacterium]|nr:NAD(P)-dependent oxidoreductase [Ignavibacteriaceae bacterium]